MLRIDETSKTLVAPQAGGLVTEAAPEREEMLALVSSSWGAFSHELGMPNVHLVAQEPVPGADLLAFDESDGRAVVLQVTGDTVEWQLARALSAAAEVASWDAAKLAEVSDALEAVVPGDSPRLVVLAGGFDPRALATVEWLSRRHGVDVTAFSVSVLRFGAERLLSVAREPREGSDAASDVQWMLSGTSLPAGVAPAGQPVASSTPPPGA